MFCVCLVCVLCVCVVRVCVFCVCFLSFCVCFCVCGYVDAVQDRIRCRVIGKISHCGVGEGGTFGNSTYTILQIDSLFRNSEPDPDRTFGID